MPCSTPVWMLGGQGWAGLINASQGFSDTDSIRSGLPACRRGPACHPVRTGRHNTPGVFLRYLSIGGPEPPGEHSSWGTGHAVAVSPCVVFDSPRAAVSKRIRKSLDEARLWCSA